MGSILFYLFAICSIGFALAAVCSQRILRAAVYLMFVLLNTAALYALLGAYFLAGLQVLVYVGGIVVLIVFAVMLTHQGDGELSEIKSKTGKCAEGGIGKSGGLRRLAAVSTVSSLLVATLFVVTQTKFTPFNHAGRPFDQTALDNTTVASGDPASLGRALLNYGADGYALPFEVISLVLLAAIIGGIVIARKGAPVRYSE